MNPRTVAKIPSNRSATVAVRVLRYGWGLKPPQTVAARRHPRRTVAANRSNRSSAGPQPIGPIVERIVARCQATKDNPHAA
jgi:hypothetical protein